VSRFINVHLIWRVLQLQLFCLLFYSRVVFRRRGNWKALLRSAHYTQRGLLAQALSYTTHDDCPQRFRNTDRLPIP
jgi:hypothetical protein